MRWILPAAFTIAALFAWLWSPNTTSTPAAAAAAQQEPAADDPEAMAESEPDGASQDGASQDEPEPAENEPVAEEPAEETSTGSAAPRDQAKSEGLEVFVPTEKLPAGSSVSFPVDI